jgi:hypothetical protein
MRKRIDESNLPGGHGTSGLWTRNHEHAFRNAPLSR